MSWYYNTESGALTSSGAAQSFLQDVQAGIGLGAGWHKLNIPATASMAQAAAEARKEFPTGKAPTTSVAQQFQNTPVVGPAITAAKSAAGAATDINTFLSRLTSANLWLRVGEFILGALLILSGTLKLTNHGGDLGDIAKVAKFVK